MQTGCGWWMGNRKLIWNGLSSANYLARYECVKGVIWFRCVFVSCVWVCRYNALDQLMCVICSTHIKSEILWSTHLQSRKHKDSVASLKSKKSQPQSTPAQPSKPKVKEEDTKQFSSQNAGKRKMSNEMDVCTVNSLYSGPPEVSD